MARYVRGDVVTVKFPFSSDTDFKLRPAIVLASWPYLDSTDYWVCMVSTQNDGDAFAMGVKSDDIMGGRFNRACFIRPTYTFAASERRVGRKIGQLKPAKVTAILEVIRRVLYE